MRIRFSASLILASLILASATLAQQPPPKKLEFEVASVRVAGPPVAGNLNIMGLRGGPGSTDPEHATGTIDLRNIFLRAFGVPNDQLTAPDWMQSTRYEFSAVVPPGTTPEQFNIMLQNLLIDRFQVTLHTVKKDFTVYEMVAGKNGVKLKPSTAVPDPAPAAGRGPTQADVAVIQAQAAQMLAQLRAGANNSTDSEGYPALPDDNKPAQRTVGNNGVTKVNARGQSTATLANMVQRGMGGGARVVDKTGLTGLYDFKLQYSRSLDAPRAVSPIGGNAAATTPEPDEPLPDLASALQSQLGIKLEKSTAPYDVLTIDKIQKTPTDN